MDKKILSTNSAMVAFVFDSLLAQETVEKLIGCLLVSDDSTFTKFLLLKIFGLGAMTKSSVGSVRPVQSAAMMRITKLYE